jgi:hypothetical protein
VTTHRSSGASAALQGLITDPVPHAGEIEWTTYTPRVVTPRAACASAQSTAMAAAVSNSRSLVGDPGLEPADAAVSPTTQSIGKTTPITALDLRPRIVPGRNRIEFDDRIWG